MKPFMVSCKEATYLMGLKEEGKLSTLNRLKLNMHTSMCAFCKRFEEQAKVIQSESLNAQSSKSLTSEMEKELEKLILDHH